MESPERQKPVELSKIDQKLRGNTASSNNSRSIFIPQTESLAKNSILIVENQKKRIVHLHTRPPDQIRELNDDLTQGKRLQS